MSEVKHTRGPWSVYVPSINGATYGVDGPDGEAVVYFGSNQENGIRKIHDARLIAAAPELLEVLQELVDGMTDVEDSETKVLAKARAAIARATESAS